MITIWCTTIKTDIIPRIKRWILNGLSYHSNIDTIDISPSTVAKTILKVKMVMLFMARNIFQNHAWFLFIIYIVVFKIRKKGLISSRTETCVALSWNNWLNKRLSANSGCIRTRTGNGGVFAAPDFKSVIPSMSRKLQVLCCYLGILHLTYWLAFTNFAIHPFAGESHPGTV